MREIMRTPEEVIRYYTQDRGKGLDYVRKIALSRNDDKLLKAINEAQLEKMVSIKQDELARAS